MIVVGWCVKCKEMREMINPRIEDSKRGKKYKGKCEKCGTNMSATVPKAVYSNSSKESPKEVPSIEERERLEREATDKFVEEAKENKILRENGVKVVREEYYNLLKAIVIIFAIGTLAFAYLSYNDYYSNSMICGNITCPEIPACPEQNCNPTTNCNPELICSNTSCPKCECNCQVPSDLNINVNVTG